MAFKPSPQPHLRFCQLVFAVPTKPTKAENKVHVNMIYLLPDTDVF